MSKRRDWRFPTHSVCKLLFDEHELGVLGYYCPDCRVFIKARDTEFETTLKARAARVVTELGERTVDIPASLPVCPTCKRGFSGFYMTVDRRTGVLRFSDVEYPRIPRKPIAKKVNGEWDLEVQFDDLDPVVFFAPKEEVALKLKLEKGGDGFGIRRVHKTSKLVKGETVKTRYPAHKRKWLRRDHPALTESTPRKLKGRRPSKKEMIAAINAANTGSNDLVNAGKMLGLITEKTCRDYDSMKAAHEKCEALWMRMNFTVPLPGWGRRVRIADATRISRIKGLIAVRMSAKYSGEPKATTSLKFRSGKYLTWKEISDRVDSINNGAFRMDRGVIHTEPNGMSLVWDPDKEDWMPTQDTVETIATLARLRPKLSDKEFLMVKNGLADKATRMVPYIEEMDDDEEGLGSDPEPAPSYNLSLWADPDALKKRDWEYMLKRIPGYSSIEEHRASFQGPAKDRLTKAEALRKKLDAKYEAASMAELFEEAMRERLAS